MSEQTLMCTYLSVFNLKTVQGGVLIDFSAVKHHPVQVALELFWGYWVVRVEDKL